mmetsp:Transcript_19728/g.59747  ORF Transcript_19728/g.59747 Transcript_19728/m.59747 type:complete len:201 (+) Transcript_19728:848-1450(+)
MKNGICTNAGRQPASGFTCVSAKSVASICCCFALSSANFSLMDSCSGPSALTFSALSSCLKFTGMSSVLRPAVKITMDQPYASSTPRSCRNPCRPTTLASTKRRNGPQPGRRKPGFAATGGGWYAGYEREKGSGGGKGRRLHSGPWGPRPLRARRQRLWQGAAAAEASKLRLGDSPPRRAPGSPCAAPWPPHPRGAAAPR